MRVLALDPATVTGWATTHYMLSPNKIAQPLVVSGREDFSIKRGDSPGLKFLKFRGWLEDKIRNFKPGVICYERQHHRGGASTESALGFVTEIKTVAASHDIELYAVHTGELKKFAAGHGKASKIQMQAAAKKFCNVDCEDDNEADAICLLYFAHDHLNIPLGTRFIRRRWKNGKGAKNWRSVPKENKKDDQKDRKVQRSKKGRSSVLIRRRLRKD